MNDHVVEHAAIATPLGTMRLVTDGTAVLALEFDAPVIDSTPRSTAAREIADAVTRHLDAYFARRRVMLDVPLAPSGTPFQQDVWSALRGIPHGETVSYAEIARRVGRPSAVRAVGAANGRNPIAILIPCHRVIGADGTLTGYGGGLDRKRALLLLEAPAPLALFAA
jgi:methylated-DNA-[protein]-cysteine S-methyltransferase